MIIGPTSIANYAAFTWPKALNSLTGVSYAHSQIRSAQIPDGLSNTYLVGTDIDPNQFTTVRDLGDSETAFTGFDANCNTVRYGGTVPRPPPSSGAPPQHETPGTSGSTSYKTIWGSIRPTACHFVFCDGSVHDINFSINAQVHQRLSNRADGQQIDQSQF